MVTTRYPNQSIQTQSTDRDGDGTVDYKRFYDTKGRTIRMERDLDDDGTVDELELWIYDDANRVMRHTRDTDMDGNPESKSELRYDAEGRDGFGAMRGQDGENEGVDQRLDRAGQTSRKGNEKQAFDRVSE